MTAMEQQADEADRFGPAASLVDRAIRAIQFIAPPSLVQLVLRFALAVPFWRSGILKWDGFLQLNDTAVTLFHRRVEAASSGRALSIPCPGCDGVPLWLRRNRLSCASRSRTRRPVRSAWPPVHDPHRRTDRAGRVAHPHHLGGHGACDHGLWSREVFVRPFHSAAGFIGRRTASIESKLRALRRGLHAANGSATSAISTASKRRQRARAS
jgi:hypothetical protein